MSDEQGGKEGGGDSFRDGVRSITGMLGALKEALEATFDDLREQGEFTPERAREAAAATFRKAQEVVEDVRGRLEFVPRAEFEELRQEVAALRARLEAREGGAAESTGEAGPGAPGEDTGPSERPPFRFEVE